MYNLSDLSWVKHATGSGFVHRVPRLGEKFLFLPPRFGHLCHLLLLLLILFWVLSFTSHVLFGMSIFQPYDCIKACLVMILRSDINLFST